MLPKNTQIPPYPCLVLYFPSLQKIASHLMLCFRSPPKIHRSMCLFCICLLPKISKSHPSYMKNFLFFSVVRSSLRSQLHHIISHHIISFHVKPYHITYNVAAASDQWAFFFFRLSLLVFIRMFISFKNSLPLIFLITVY